MRYCAARVAYVAVTLAPAERCSKLMCIWPALAACCILGLRPTCPFAHLPVMLCCAVLCCAVLCCAAVQGAVRLQGGRPGRLGHALPLGQEQGTHAPLPLLLLLLCRHLANTASSLTPSLLACPPCWPAPTFHQILLDPYAKHVKGRAVFGKRDDFEQFKTRASLAPAHNLALHMPRCQLPRLSPRAPPACPPLQEGSVFRGTFDFEAEPFDWGAAYKRPDIPLKDLVIAELPVRLFTGGWLVGRWVGGWVVVRHFPPGFPWSCFVGWMMGQG